MNHILLLTFHEPGESRHPLDGFFQEPCINVELLEERMGVLEQVNYHQVRIGGGIEGMVDTLRRFLLENDTVRLTGVAFKGFPREFSIDTKREVARALGVI